MSAETVDATVSESVAYDFCEPDRGLFGLVSVEHRNAETLALAVAFELDKAVILSTDSGQVRVEEQGAGARVAANTDKGSLELRFEPHGPPAVIAETSEVGELLAAEREVTVCRVHGEMVRNGRRDRIDCLGTRTRTTARQAPEAVEIGRSISIVLDGGGLLCAWAARPMGVKGHADEAVSSVMAEPGKDPEPLDELLLSTQYDDAGRHRRATLEGWVETAAPEVEGDAEGPPEPEGPYFRLLRGAGVLVCGTSLELDGWRANTAFFRWSVSGRPGLGRYDVVRRPA